MNEKKYIAWFSGDGINDVQLAEVYTFESTLDGAEILDDGKVIGTDEFGKACTFNSKNEYLAYWDDIEASKAGNRLHYFEKEDAIVYIANDMKDCDSEKGIAEMYSEVLGKVSKLLD